MTVCVAVVVAVYLVNVVKQTHGSMVSNAAVLLVFWVVSVSSDYTTVVLTAVVNDTVVVATTSDG